MRLGMLGFFNDVFNFLKGGRVLGLDIGTASIKLVEISKKGEHFCLDNYGILETRDYFNQASRALQTGAFKLIEKEAARLLSILLKEICPKSNLVMVSLPSFLVFTTSFEMPLLQPKETQSAVLFQAKQFIPLPVSKVSIDWIVVDEFENERGQQYQRILLIGIPNEVVDIYKRIVSRAGLKPIMFEFEGLSLVRALLEKDNQRVLLVDIGALVTSIVVVDNAALKYGSTVDYGGFYLTQALKVSLGISNFRAEELKRRRGLLGQGGEKELSTLLLGFLDVIIKEISRIKNTYEERYGKKVQKLVISGAGANLTGIGEYFSRQLGLELEHPNLFWNIEYNPQIESVVKYISNELAAAIGAAKRYFQ